VFVQKRKTDLSSKIPNCLDGNCGPIKKLRVLAFSESDEKSG